jgi:hypothetical protein
MASPRDPIGGGGVHSHVSRMMSNLYVCRHCKLSFKVSADYSLLYLFNTVLRFDTQATFNLSIKSATCCFIDVITIPGSRTAFSI